MTDPNSEYPLTRNSLLVQLKNEQDHEAWEQFISIYRPIIYRTARKRGLQDADAQDLAQQILFSISQSIGRWEQRDESVRFRHWLRRTARNAILNALTRRQQDRAVGGTEIQQAFAAQPVGEEQLAQEIELEHRREIFFAATELLKKELSSDALIVFQESVLNRRSIDQVAKTANKSVGATYAARGRALKRLREIIDLMMKEYE